MKEFISTFKKRVITLVVLCGGMSLMAQTISVTGDVGTITVTAQGELTTAINALPDKTSVTDLTVSSSTSDVISENDAKAINSLTALKTLDMSGFTQSTLTSFLNAHPSIETFIYPAGVTLLANSFINNVALKAVAPSRASVMEGVFEIPSSMTNPGNMATGRVPYGNPLITAYAYNATSNVSVVDGVFLGWNNTWLYSYPSGRESETYTIPTTVTNIAQGSFYSQTKLKKIIVPAATASISYTNAFTNSTSIEFIEVAEENTVYGSTDAGILYEKASNTLVYLPPAQTTYETITAGGTGLKIGDSFLQAVTNLKTLIVADGTVEIGNTVATSKSTLETIYLPASLTTLGSATFQQNANLSLVVFYGDTPSCTGGTTPFRDCGSATGWIFDTYVPNSYLSNYTAAATQIGIGAGNFKPHFAITEIDATAEVESPTITGIVIKDDVVTLTADAAPAGEVFYNWEITDDAGGSDITNDITFTEGTASSATAKITMPAADITVKAVYGTASSIQNTESSKVSIYPNPAIDYIYVTGGAEGEGYVIYNVLGSLVAQGTLSGNAISVNNLETGIYVFETEGNVIQFIKK